VKEEQAMATLTRVQAIDAIRRAILKLVDDEHSACEVAAEKGVFCHGFRRYSDEELRKRYKWLMKGKESMGREELEDLANRWQIARRVVDGTPICCDAQTQEQDTCRGWEDFDNPTLSKYYKELLGKEVTVS